MNYLKTAIVVAMILCSSVAWSCGCMDGKTMLTQDGHAVTFQEDTTVSPSGGMMTMRYHGVTYSYPYSDADCPIIEILAGDGWRYYFNYEDMLLELTGNYMYTD